MISQIQKYKHNRSIIEIQREKATETQTQEGCKTTVLTSKACSYARPEGGGGRLQSCECRKPGRMLRTYNQNSAKLSFQ
uniref:Putative ovule protein n=1 Tax=Solanum chacoense TaxID=4108 RepID=A0A0V0GY73_SOLCH